MIGRRAATSGRLPAGLVPANAEQRGVRLRDAAAWRCAPAAE